MTPSIGLSRCFILLLLVALTGCVSPGPKAGLDRSTADAYLERGDYAAAARTFQELAAADRASRANYLIEAAEALLANHDGAAAAKLVEKLKRKTLGGSFAARFDLVLAQLALDKGDAEQALSLATVSSEGLALRQRESAAQIRAAALIARERYVDAAREQVALALMQDKSQRGEREATAIATLARLDARALNAQLKSLPIDDSIRPWIERALRKLGAAPVRVVAQATHEAGAWLPAAGGQRLREGYAGASRVALLLPLSGDLAAAGRAVRDGFFAAYFADESQRPAIKVFDSASTGEGARIAYRQAIESGAERVVGPLGRVEVQALLEGEGPSVPLFALNLPDYGLALDGGSAAFALAPDEEAALAAERARDRHYTRAAIIVAQEEWGERAALAFRAQFELGGGVVAGEARVPATGADYSASIRQALAGGADVVFLSVRPPQGRLLVPQLRNRGAPQLPVIATSHIYTGGGNRALDRDLNGVEFCDSPWLFGLSTGLPPRDSLSRSLPAAGNNPRLFAFGIDAWRLLPYIDWLSHHADAYINGASGQLSLDAFGRVHRVPAWMVFEDGAPRSVDGGLATDVSAPR